MKSKKPKLSAIFKSNNVEDTFLLAQVMAKNIKGGEIIFLYGSIGSGKTTFVKGLAKALNIRSSPISASFTLIRDYKNKTTKLTHIDAFRLSKCDSSNLGLEEVLKDEKKIVMVEWPNAVSHFFPREKIKIKIGLLAGDKRKFTFQPIGEKYVKLLEKIKNSL